MSRVSGTENQRWTLTCQDAADGTGTGTGTGDKIVPLPDGLLSELDIVMGDTLTVKKQPDGTITLTPI